jgi:ribulose-5-phosphate 4-epimerase/fuculose-1-phosphate aldolase
MDKTLVKNQICDVCSKMWQLGCVTANGGNVSTRRDRLQRASKAGRRANRPLKGVKRYAKKHSPHPVSGAA